VLRAKVEEDLKKKYSPEQIAGRLRVEFPDEPEMRVSPETIYQSLYVQSRGALKRDLAACLRTGRAMRQPCRKAGQRKNRIPGMINISERPPEVQDRAVPGQRYRECECCRCAARLPQHPHVPPTPYHPDRKIGTACFWAAERRRLWTSVPHRRQLCAQQDH
jgi:hypothetical protein